MGNVDLKELRQLIDRVMYASTKSEAKPLVRRLEFIAANMKGQTNGYLSGKLREAISYAVQASGRVRNKEHWISCAEQSWYVFENGISDEYAVKNE